MVLHLPLSHPLLQIAVAGVAQVISRLTQVVGVFCRVGIMAFDALPGDDRLVGADGLRRYDLRVAGAADLLGTDGQKLAMGGGVRVVAAGAFPRAHRGMDVRGGHGLDVFGMALQAQLALGAGLQAKGVAGAVGGGALDQQAEQEQGDRQIFQFHRGSPQFFPSPVR